MENLLRNFEKSYSLAKYLKLNMKEQSTFIIDNGNGNDTLLDYDYILYDYGENITGDSQNLEMVNGRFKTISGHSFLSITSISVTKLRFRWSF